MTDTYFDAQGAAKSILTTFTGLADNEHGQDTPHRFLMMLHELTAHRDCNGDCIKWKTFQAQASDLIVVQRIPFSSVCNHHVIPFVGYAHIGYIPMDDIAGLSKFVRVVRHFASRLQVQEDLTYQIAEFLQTKLRPEGLAVVMKAEHLCMTVRGAQSPGTYTTTARMTGVFQMHDRTAKAEFLAHLNGGHQ
jgi:GTP cyclohydrolase I